MSSPCSLQVFPTQQAFLFFNSTFKRCMMEKWGEQSNNLKCQSPAKLSVLCCTLLHQLQVATICNWLSKKRGETSTSLLSCIRFVDSHALSPLLHPFAAWHLTLRSFPPVTQEPSPQNQHIQQALLLIVTTEQGRLPASTLTYLLASTQGGMFFYYMLKKMTRFSTFRRNSPTKACPCLLPSILKS